MYSYVQKVDDSRGSFCDASPSLDVRKLVGSKFKKSFPTSLSRHPMNAQANQTKWRDDVPFSAEQIQLPTMRVVLYLLLTGLLLIEPSGSLWCYTCRTQVKTDNCKKAIFCKDKTKSCKTDVINLMGLLSVVSKECAPSCTVYYKDLFIGGRNVSCCSSDLCNVGGFSASSAHSAQMMMVAFISSACIVLSRLL